MIHWHERDHRSKSNANEGRDLQDQNRGVDEGEQHASFEFRAPGGDPGLLGQSAALPGEVGARVVESISVDLLATPTGDCLHP